MWFIDGTFSTAPEPFKQLFIIRARLGYTQVAVSCAYALLIFSKLTETYSGVLQKVRQELIVHREVPLVSKVMADFEPALRRAASTVLGPNDDIRGCFFHVSQVRRLAWLC